MIRSLYTAASGMTAQQLNMDVVANNLANVSTNGFKRSRANFQDLMYQVTRAAGTSAAQGAQVPTGVQVGLGTRAASVERIYQQGDFRKTDNPLDMVIEGEGFFQVQTPDGQTAYTRDGSFKRDSQGRVVTSDGFVVQPEITIPANMENIRVEQDGTVFGQAADGTQQEFGKIQIARFVNPQGLEAMGRNLLRATAASGDATVGEPGLEGRGSIASGFVEMSNVKVVEEMVDMITAQRAYEVNSKSIQASDEMLQAANNLRR